MSRLTALRPRSPLPLIARLAEQDWGVGQHDHGDQLARKRRPDTYGLLTQSCPPVLEGCERPNQRLYEYPPEVGLE